MKKIIEVQNIAKRYSIKDSSTYTHKSLSESLISIPKKLTKIGKRSDVQDFWAIKDVSFDIEEGERVGIIGRNGAGKSTLLKLLSRISAPTKGQIYLRGRLSSLLEVGTGFHPELTGRENIYLNGAILGMSRFEIQKRFDSIVDFSGVSKFLDTPVKRYSSGMYVRLAFAVAANLEPEILLVDEVLAVGDSDFQKKCIGKMDEVSKRDGRTIILVSHNMSAIRGLCNRSIWIDQGTVKHDGSTPEVIGSYLKQNVSSGWKKDFDDVSRYGSGEARCLSAAIEALSPEGEVRSYHLCSGDDLKVKLEVVSYEELFKVDIQCIIFDVEGTRVVDGSLTMMGKPINLNKNQKISINWHFKNLLLSPGQYLIAFYIGQKNKDIDGVPEVLTLNVTEQDNSPYFIQFPARYRCQFDISCSENL